MVHVSGDFEDRYYRWIGIHSGFFVSFSISSHVSCQEAKDSLRFIIVNT